jgi:hypothetical protein
MIENLPTSAAWQPSELLDLNHADKPMKLVRLFEAEVCFQLGLRLRRRSALGPSPRYQTVTTKH